MLHFVYRHRWKKIDVLCYRISIVGQLVECNTTRMTRNVEFQFYERIRFNRSILGVRLQRVQWRFWRRFDAWNFVQGEEEISSRLKLARLSVDWDKLLCFSSNWGILLNEPSNLDPEKYGIQWKDDFQQEIKNKKMNYEFKEIYKL